MGVAGLGVERHQGLQLLQRSRVLSRVTHVGTEIPLARNAAGTFHSSAL